MRLLASYGGDLGFFYTLGPQWATQTAVSIGKASSPVLQDSGQTVGYLTQSLNYHAGNRASFRGSVDVGLTDDSSDAYVGLSYNSFFKLHQGVRPMESDFKSYPESLNLQVEQSTFPPSP